MPLFHLILGLAFIMRALGFARDVAVETELPYPVQETGGRERNRGLVEFVLGVIIFLKEFFSFIYKQMCHYYPGFLFILILKTEFNGRIGRYNLHFYFP